MKSIALLLGLCALCTGADAYAHDPPYVVDLAWQSPEADALPIVLSNRGLLFVGSGGDTRLRVRCNEAYGVNTASEPVLLVDPAGDLTVATDSQVQTSSDGACTFTKSMGLPALPLISAVTSPTEPNRVLITTADYERGSQLFASEDYGKSWLLRSVLPPATSYRKLVYGSGGRVYARGNYYDAATRQLIGVWASSLDHGASFEELPLASDREPLGVHPTNPALVFAREPLSSALGEYPDRLLRSEDGGKSFSVVFELPRVTAFAATPDGAVIWLGTQTTGLYRSLDGGLHFERTLEANIASVHYLVYRQERLWLGGTGTRGYEAVWMSADRGTSIRQMVRLDAIASAVSCAPAESAICEASDRHLREELSSTAAANDGETTPGIRIETSDVKVIEPMPVPAPPMMAPAQDDEGCATRGAAGSSSFAWFALLMLVRARRKRRCAAARS